MAKKPDKELADPYERVISKTLNGVNASKVVDNPEYLQLETGGDWKPVPVNPTALFYEDSIDLSGYHLQELTFFPELAFKQMNPLMYMQGSDGGTAVDMIVITTVPQEVDWLYLHLISGGGPGMPETGTFPPAGQTPVDWQAVPYCSIDIRARNDATPGDFGVMTLIDSGQLGSLQPTAADKLFIYRIVFPFTNTAPNIQFTQLMVPSVRIGFRGEMAMEADREYLMRLKRGYELANQS